MGPPQRGRSQVWKSEETAMKLVPIALAGLLAATQAQAISRYNSLGLTCGEAQAIVDAEGAAIMRYQSARNPSLTLYDRYVRHRGFCQIPEITVTEWIPTADTPSCPLLICRMPLHDDFFFHDD
jgi:hypothetical protein